jgi:hypothetical protein
MLMLFVKSGVSTSIEAIANSNSNKTTASLLYTYTNVYYYVARRHKFCLTDLTVSKFARKYDVLF